MKILGDEDMEVRFISAFGAVEKITTQTVQFNQTIMVAINLNSPKPRCQDGGSEISSRFEWLCITEPASCFP